MTASDAAVKAAEKAMGCHHGNGNRGCDAHRVGWTDRGCWLAVKVADAVAAIAARETLEQAASALDGADQGWDWVAAWIAARAEALQ